MEAKNLFILTTLAVTTSFIFSSCKKELNEKIETKLSFINDKNTNYLYSINLNNDMNIIRKDSIQFDGNKCSKSSFIKNDIILNKLIHSCGVYDLVKKTSFEFENLLPLSMKDNCIFLYEIEEKSISKFDINTNQLTKIDSLKPINFQIFNNKPLLDCISSDFSNIITMNAIENDEKWQSYNFYLKNLITNKEILIIENIKGSKILKTSNAVSVPSIKWIDGTKFIYTDYKDENNNLKCLVYQFNTLTNKSILLGEISNIKETSNNYKFLNNKDGFYIRIDNLFYKIDIENNRVFKSDFNLGNNFSVFIENGNYQLKFKEKNIDGLGGKIPLNSSFELNSDFIRVHDNKIVVMFRKRLEGSNPVWKNTCLIWSNEIKSWKELEIEGKTMILSLN